MENTYLKWIWTDELNVFCKHLITTTIEIFITMLAIYFFLVVSSFLFPEKSFIVSMMETVAEVGILLIFTLDIAKHIYNGYITNFQRSVHE